MKTNRKGFTLIELIVVIAVLSILTFLIVPQVTGYVGQSQSVVCENNRDAVLREYEMKHAQDDSVTLKSVLDTYKTVCPDSKGVVTVGSDGESLICSIHGGSTEKSGALQELQSFIDSFAGKELNESVLKAAKNNLMVTPDQVSIVTAAADNANILSDNLPQKMYWNARLVTDSDGKQAVAMLAHTGSYGDQGYLLYYNSHLYYYQSNKNMTKGWIDRTDINSILPSGDAAKLPHGWVLAQ